MRFYTTSFALLILASTSAGAPPKPIYQDDPTIVEQLKALKPGQSLVLPPVKVTGEGVERYKSRR